MFKHEEEAESVRVDKYDEMQEYLKVKINENSEEIKKLDEKISKFEDKLEQVEKERVEKDNVINDLVKRMEMLENKFSQTCGEKDKEIKTLMTKVN